MSKWQFPDNFAEHRGEFNEISSVDWNALSDNEKIKYKELDATKGTKLTEIDRKYAENWQSRVDAEKQKILDKLSQQRQQPQLKPGGQQFGRQAGGAGKTPSQEQLQEMAEENVRREKQNEIDRTQKKYEQAQKDLIQNAAGKNRNAGHER